MHFHDFEIYYYYVTPFKMAQPSVKNSILWEQEVSKTDCVSPDINWGVLEWILQSAHTAYRSFNKQPVHKKDSL